MRINSKYPKSIGVFNLNPEEFCYTVYMPIKVKHQYSIPDYLEWVTPLLDNVQPKDHTFTYWYFTVKYMWVDGYGNRPGWHIDGFGSDDINYIWSDCNPTEFCVQEFYLSDDHKFSLYEMEEQAQEENTIRSCSSEFVRLDNTIVHRCVATQKPMLRAFVKISCSDNFYNLKGNARNPNLPIGEEYVEREWERNHPVKN